VLFGCGLLDLHSEVVVLCLDDAFCVLRRRVEPGTLHACVAQLPDPPRRPIDLREGTLLDYRIRLHGVPLRWRTQIDVWEPGVRFVDRQVVGPYHWWRHEHRFEAVAGGTRVVDHVEYKPRVAWVSRRWVQRDVERIFDYRRQALLRDLADQAASGSGTST
jgi:ligand-binding SRPBCC domain-containing protein